MSFELVCELAQLPVGQPMLAEIGGLRVAMVHADDGQVYAVADECSHGKVSLSEGEVDGCYIECWLHGSRFDLRTGKPKTPPATMPIATYPVRIEGTAVLVDVTES